MSETEYDYNNYDYLNVSLNRDVQSRLLEYYTLLGWEQVEVVEDKLYRDVTHRTMRRRHDVPDKDERLFYQARMESRINKLAYLTRHRHSRSRGWGIFLGVVAALLMLGGGVIAALAETTGLYVLAAVTAGVGAIVAVANGILVSRIRSREKKEYAAGTRMRLDEIKELSDAIKALVGQGAEDGRAS